jgi:hypothetical protein
MILVSAYRLEKSLLKSKKMVWTLDFDFLRVHPLFKCYKECRPCTWTLL